MAKANWRRLRNSDWLTLVGYIISIPLDVLFSVEIPGFDIHLSDDKAADNPILDSGFNSFTYYKIHTRSEDYQTLSDLSNTSAIGSAATYIGRSIDRVADYKTPFYGKLREEDEHIQREERENPLRDYGTIAGIIAGLAIGIPIAVLLFLYGGWMFILALTIFTAALAIIRSTAGLGSRIMQLADKIRDKKYGDLLKNYEASILLSLLIGVIPIAIMGYFGGLGSGIFDIVSFVITSVILLSTVNSGAHYVGRLLDFIDERYSLGWLLIGSLLQKFGVDMEKYQTDGAWKKDEAGRDKPWIENFKERCTNEQLANIGGLILGLVVGILAVTALSIFTPSVMLIIPGFLVLKYCLTVFGLMNTFASIAIRFGRMVDRLYSTDEKKAPTVLHWAFDWEPSDVEPDKNAVKVKQEEVILNPNSDVEVIQEASSQRESPIPTSESESELPPQDVMTVAYLRDKVSYDAAHKVGFLSAPSVTPSAVRYTDIIDTVPEFSVALVA